MLVLAGFIFAGVMECFFVERLQRDCECVRTSLGG